MNIVDRKNSTENNLRLQYLLRFRLITDSTSITCSMTRLIYCIVKPRYLWNNEQRNKTRMWTRVFIIIIIKHENGNWIDRSFGHFSKTRIQQYYVRVHVIIEYTFYFQYVYIKIRTWERAENNFLKEIQLLWFYFIWESLII